MNSSLSKKLCTIATVVYHLTFLGGAHYYVSEFDKLKTLINKKAKEIEDHAKKLDKRGADIESSINSVESSLSNVERVCKKLRF